MEIYDKYKNLKKSEKDFLWAHPIAAATFNSNANAALAEANKRFGPSTLHNGSGDAFRHCFWAAMNARDESADLAKQFGDAHEDFVGNPKDEKKMDLHNNGMGYKLGAENWGASDRHLAVLCVEAWAGKKLVQIDEYGLKDLIYSNSQESWLYEAGK